MPGLSFWCEVPESALCVAGTRMHACGPKGLWYINTNAAVHARGTIGIVTP
jgi:hypothetical protein